MRNKNFYIFYLFTIFIYPRIASAHEAYVTTPQEFKESMARSSGWLIFSALTNPHNLQILYSVTVGIIIVFVLNFIFRLTKAGEGFYNSLHKHNRFGPVISRLAIAISFFYSAFYWKFLGPEISLQGLPEAGLIRIFLFTASICILFGFLTEFFAAASLIVFIFAGRYFGWYLTTYLNYLGKLLVLVLFGSRFLSIDKLIFHASKRFESLKKYRILIIRTAYGLSLIYASILVKFMHSNLTIQIVKDYHLTNYGWLFPHDPMLVALGAGIAELAIGLFIILGFELKLTVFISLFYITLSLAYFQELVWPHILLYGISLDLLLGYEDYTLDNFILKKLKVWRKK